MHLESALPIVKALADGVNPVTGEQYPEQSPYAEPRALRALFAAVDLMQREVERNSAMRGSRSMNAPPRKILTR